MNISLNLCFRIQVVYKLSGQDEVMPPHPPHDFLTRQVKLKFMNEKIELAAKPLFVMRRA